MKSDNREEIGMHVFERAGLGKAPFRFAGYSENVIKYPDGTVKAGGSCQYCYTGIRHEFAVESAEGRRFVVGCECIQKSGDAGLIEAYKTSPEYREIQAEKRATKARAMKAELEAWVYDAGVRAACAAMPHPNGLVAKTALDYLDFMWERAGAAGRSRVLKWLKRNLGDSKTGVSARGDLEATEQAAKLAQEREEDKKKALAAARAKIMHHAAFLLADGMNGFRDSVAWNMQEGVIPSGEARSITCDILARQAGRCGSQKYLEAHEWAEQVFRDAEDVDR